MTQIARTAERRLHAERLISPDALREAQTLRYAVFSSEFLCLFGRLVCGVTGVLRGGISAGLDPVSCFLGRIRDLISQV